jgi:hypothetical protein
MVDPLNDLRFHVIPSLPPSIAKLNNQELIAVFKDLQELANVINAGTASRKLPPAIDVQNRICAAQYRLLELQGKFDDSVTEGLILGLLAFLATLFQVPGTKLGYPYLVKRFRDVCSTMEASEPHLRDLVLWLLMMGAISLFGATEPWLRQRWQLEAPPQLTWDELRQRLKDVLWIQLIHDQPGQHAFNILNVMEDINPPRDISAVTLWASGWSGCTYKI